MTSIRVIALTVGLSIALAIGACGGGSSGETIVTPPPPPPPPPTGGIGRFGVAVGPVSTFGSIVVNGVHYETTSASFTIDGNPATESDLKVGQVVKVEGTINDDSLTGTADTVITDDDVTGAVESVDLALGQLVVLGQLVLVGPETSFDDNIIPASLDGISVGDIVEVSGFFNANSDIVASRIENKPVGTQLEVHGTVSSLDAANSLFSINSLIVDYSGAMLQNFPGGSISDGDFVEAKGASLDVNGRLTATIVELETVGVSGAVDTHVEIEGFITRFASATDFDVSGVRVTTDAGTTYEGGTVADLGLNIKVEVEGDLDANGVLVADKVDIRRSKAVRSTAVVDSVDAAAGSLVMLGITFTTDELTRFEDKSNADVSPLTINDLNAGDYLEIRGAEFPSGSGQILATILEREDLDTRTELQGFVESEAGSTLTILGVTIDAGSTTVFRDVDDSLLTEIEFFNLVDVNSLVKATGTESSDTTISATELELELEF